jgi:NADH:ubiquinone oxidoreductase subunit 2 (subunit N)
MFLLFTPFSYLFLTVYILVIFFMLTLRNFYMFWLYIEISILLFIGLSYTIFVHSYTQLMLYFLIQTLASFGILVFYTLSSDYLLYFALFLKLGMFPFISWYLNVLYRFPSFTLLIRRTLHKLPPLFLFYTIYDSYFTNFVLVSVLLSLIVGGLYILTILDIRYLIVVSSIANNSFLLLGLISGNFVTFSFFFTLYFFTMLFVLITFKGLIKPLINPNFTKYRITLLTIILLLNMASIPPLPIFLAKFLVIYDFLQVRPLSFSLLIVLVLANVTIIARYCQLFIKFVTQTYSNSSIHLLH